MARALLRLPLLRSRGLDGDEKKRIAVIVVLFIFAVVFWAAFEQAPTSLNLFARDFTDRTRRRLGDPGDVVPVGRTRSSSSCFAPVFAALWVGARRSAACDLSSPTKFALGLSLAGLGFLLMIVAAEQRHRQRRRGARLDAGGSSASYFLQTLGELCAQPRRPVLDDQARPEALLPGR